jgi:monovalent cation:H+ antiporter-2, CPA2 family
MDSVTFIQDLAIVLLAAGIAGVVCRRLGLSVIVGYLVAGMVVGPHTPPFSLVLDVKRIETLSSIGLIFLMFAIGLGLSLTKLRQLGASTIAATALGAYGMLSLTQLLGVFVGWSGTQSLFVAAMFMVSSSAVIAKIVHELNLGHEPPGQLALGVTVLEDVVAVVMLAILGSHVGGLGAVAGTDVGGLLATLGAFVVLLVMAGLFLLPRLFRRLEARADPELQTIIVAGVLFLMALLAVRAGYSLALGAFLLGAIVAEMPQSRRVERSFAGMRDMFSSVFFVSIGMMIDVRLLPDVWPWVLGLSVFTLVGRALALSLALLAVGTPLREARRAGLALTPLGEFTFVIAQVGVGAAVLPPEFYPIAVGVSIITVLLAPLLNRHAEPVLRVVERLEPAWFHRLVGTWHDWLSQLGGINRGVWWRLSRGRLVQIGLEVLFVTGLLIFSERLFEALAASPLAAGQSRAMLQLVFWSGMALLVLIPLVAIWRNLAALAMIFGEAAAERTRLPAALVENALKVVNALALASWLTRIIPGDALPGWAWLVIGLSLVVVLAFFSRRLIYLHSEWQSSLRGVLDLGPPPADAATPAWMETSGDWDLNVQECVLPERFGGSGRTIADLAVRARHGCSITEINRQGHTIVAPEPKEALYAGDRLLLLGTSAQIAAARAELTRETPPGDSRPSGSPRARAPGRPSRPCRSLAARACWWRAICATVAGSSTRRRRRSSAKAMNSSSSAPRAT